MNEEKSLMEKLLDEIIRVTEMRSDYIGLPKNAGAFALAEIDKSIAKAKDAISNQDTVAMLVMIMELRDYEN